MITLSDSKPSPLLTYSFIFQFLEDVNLEEVSNDSDLEEQLPEDDVRDGGEDDVDVLAVRGARVVDVRRGRMFRRVQELALDILQGFFIIRLENNGGK